MDKVFSADRTDLPIAEKAGGWRGAKSFSEDRRVMPRRAEKISAAPITRKQQ